MQFFNFVVALLLSTIVFYSPPSLAQKSDSSVSQPGLEKNVETLKTRLEDLEKKSADLKHLEEKLALKEMLVSGLTEVRKDTLNNGQKAVDWWLTAVAVLLTVVAFIVPFFASKFRQEHKAEIELIRKLRAEATEERAAITAILSAAKVDQKEINLARTRLAEPASLDLNELPKETVQDAIDVAASKEAPLSERLYAQGITAAVSSSWQRAERLFAASTELSPSDSLSNFAWGAVLSELADASLNDEEKKRLRLEELSRYEAAVKAKPDMHEALYNWGAALGQLADATDDVDEKKRLRLAEISRYEAAVKVKPDKYEALNNWGAALGKLADTTDDVDEKRRLRLGAISRYEAAAKANPDEHEALNNWGVALGQLADATDDVDEKKRLRLEAISRYEAAVKLKPDKYEVLNNWGAALGKLADTTDDVDEKKRLRLGAISRYEAAVKVKPDKFEALSNWGVALGQLAVTTEGAEREQILTAAADKYDQAAAILGYVSYNQACIKAIRGLPAQFVTIAESLPEGELPDKNHIDNDTDLNAIRSSPEFVAWYKRTFLA